MERDWRGEGLLRSMGFCDQSPGDRRLESQSSKPWEQWCGAVWGVWACLCDHPEELGRVSALGVSTENQHPLGQAFRLLACRKSAFLNIIIAMWILLISHEDFFFKMGYLYFVLCVAENFCLFILFWQLVGKFLPILLIFKMPSNILWYFGMFLSNHFSETIIDHFMKGTLETVNLSQELFQNALFYRDTYICIYIFRIFM